MPVTRISITDDPRNHNGPKDHGSEDTECDTDMCKVRIG